jgi:hypothetical protein
VRAQFGILIGPAGGSAGCHPIVEGGPRGFIFLLGTAALQLGLVQRGLCGHALFARFIQPALHGVGTGRHELFDADVGFHLRQVADHGIAQPDQEKGEDEGDQPQRPNKPFFRKAKRAVHGRHAAALAPPCQIMKGLGKAAQFA